MGKQLEKKLRLSIDDAPIPQKRKDQPAEKLGLISKETHKMRTYRLRIEAIDALEQLTKKINKKLHPIKLSNGKIIEILVMNASKDDIDHIIDSIKDH